MQQGAHGLQVPSPKFYCPQSKEHYWLGSKMGRILRVPVIPCLRIPPRIYRLSRKPPPRYDFIHMPAPHIIALHTWQEDMKYGEV